MTDLNVLKAEFSDEIGQAADAFVAASGLLEISAVALRETFTTEEMVEILALTLAVKRSTDANKDAGLIMSKVRSLTSKLTGFLGAARKRL